MSLDDWLAKREKRRNPEDLQFNSTFRGEKKPMRKVGKKGRANRMMDSECADAVMSRDGYECQPCLWLYRKRTDAVEVHHILRKNTHKGVDARFWTGYQVAICRGCHNDEHDGRLRIEVMPLGDQVTQIFSRGGEGVSREHVSNVNPFAEDED